MKATAIILAGGKSSRMGTNKALLKLEGETVIERIVRELDPIVENKLIVTNSFDDFKYLHLPMVQDEFKEMGPLAGIHAGLTKTETEKNVVIACDMPFITANLFSIMIDYLNEYQAVVPVFNDRLQPLFAAYRKDILTEVKQALVTGNLKIRNLFDHLNVKYLKEEDLIEANIPLKEMNFYNMNNPDEYEYAIQLMKDQGKPKC